MKRLGMFGLLAVAALASGCWEPAWPTPSAGGGTVGDRDGGLPAGNFTWYQDVLPIVRTKCAQCHGNPPQFAATMPMMSYQDVLAFGTGGQPVHQMMAERVVAERGRMPPASQPALDENEINTILAWSAQGAPMGTPVADITWHRDVEPVVRDACQFCHADPPQFSAPMPLVTYENVRAIDPEFAVPYFEIMASRIQASSGRMPPATHNRQLTPEEISMITAWAEAGAPEGEEPPPRDAGVGRDGGTPDSGPGTPWRNGPGSPDIADPNLRWYDTWAHDNGDPTDPYDVPMGETLYRCWSFLVETAEPVEYVTWMEPILDTTSNTHHLMAYIDDSGGDTSPNPVGPFDCEGFPLEAVGGEFAEYIDGWFPGRGLTPFPDGIGIPVRDGDRVVLQAHYDRVTAPLEDMSGIRLILDTSPHTDSGTLWTGVIWGTPLMGRSTRAGECIITQNTTIYQGFPHMHTYGLSIRTELSRGGVAPFEVIMEVPAWNFDDQPILPVPMEYQQLQAGDVLRTTCNWDTGNESVNQGEGSLDEMCYNTFFSYPPLPNVGVAGDCVAFAP